MGKGIPLKIIACFQNRFTAVEVFNPTSLKTASAYFFTSASTLQCILAVIIITSTTLYHNMYNIATHKLCSSYLKKQLLLFHLLVPIPVLFPAIVFQEYHTVFTLISFPTSEKACNFFLLGISARTGNG